MRFRCHVKQLQDAIGIAVKAIGNRPSIPILEGLLVEALDDCIRLTGCDEIMTIETTIEASILEKGRLVLPGRLLADVVRKLPDADVELRFDELDKGYKAYIRCLGSKTMLTGLSPDEFPKPREVDEKIGVQVPQKGLKTLIQRTLFSVATDESRPILTGASLEILESGLVMAALDGFRLAIARTSIDSPCQAPFQVVIPGKVLGELSHILEDGETMANISLNSQYAMFKASSTKITARLLEGEFMKYRQILPNDWQTKLITPMKELSAALDRASLIARVGKNNLVRFSICDNTLLMSSNSEQNQSQEEVDGVAIEGKPLEIAFNEKYLIDIFKVIDDDSIEMRFQTNVSPCIIRPLEGDEYLYLVLPVRVYTAPD